MKIKDVLDEMFDISKLKQTRDLQKNIEKIDQFVRANPNAAKDISNSSAEMTSSFASILAASQAALQQEADEKNKKEIDEKKRSALLNNSRAGIGTTIPISQQSSTKEAKK